MRRRGPENINFWWGMWWIAVAIFFLGIVCLLTGCKVKAEAKEEAGRFEIAFRQDMSSYSGVYVFRDGETGREYLYCKMGNSGGLALMPEPVEEETFTGETEPMIFKSALPEVDAAEVERDAEEPETNAVSVIRNKVNWPGGPRQGEPDRAGRRPGPEGGLGHDDGVKGDLELLALVIYQEAGGDMCSDETRQMVGEVVLNRVADKRYPCTIEGVITQPYQYGLLHKTGPVWPERADNPGEQHAVERAYETGWALLIDDVERLLPEDVIYQAEFEQGKETVAEADGFYFCR